MTNEQLAALVSAAEYRDKSAAAMMRECLTCAIPKLEEAFHKQ